MSGAAQTLPGRVFETRDRFVLATPMPGLEPADIAVTVDGDSVTLHGNERGPHQHDLKLVLAEWSFGPYHREVTLPQAANSELTNVTYDNGVLVLTLPKLCDGQPTVRTDIVLQAILATRGEHVGHVGRESRPTTTREHWIAKHKTAHRPSTSSVDDTAPVK
jgi:HSP20 family molecular chaperone IbpA